MLLIDFVGLGSADDELVVRAENVIRPDGLILLLGLGAVSRSLSSRILSQTNNRT